MIAATAPRFHSLTGTQPVGQTQVATTSEIAATVTTVTRKNREYWVVTVRAVRNAFLPAKRDMGKSVTVWRDSVTGQYVVDYWGTDFARQIVEADRCRSLAAAIGVAVDVATQRWLVSQ